MYGNSASKNQNIMFKWDIFFPSDKSGPKGIGRGCLPCITAGLHKSRLYCIHPYLLWLIKIFSPIVSTCATLACHYHAETRASQEHLDSWLFLACIAEPTWDFISSSALLATTDKDTFPARQETHFHSAALAGGHESGLLTETTVAAWWDYAYKCHFPRAGYWLDGIKGFKIFRFQEWPIKTISAVEYMVEII